MSIKESWAMEADMDQRDPKNINDHLQIAYEDVLAEPDHTHTIDCVWKYSFKCFNMCKTLCYLIITVLCGIPHACCWGCYFACMAWTHVWEVTPCMRVCDIQLAVIGKFVTMCCNAIVSPVCDSCSGVFAAFKK